MGALVRDNCWARWVSKCIEFVTLAKRRGEIIIKIEGGIAYVVGAPKDTVIHIIDMDDILEQECEKADTDGAVPDEWYQNTIYTVYGQGGPSYDHIMEKQC